MYSTSFDPSAAPSARCLAVGNLWEQLSKAPLGAHARAAACAQQPHRRQQPATWHAPRVRGEGMREERVGDYCLACPLSCTPPCLHSPSIHPFSPFPPLVHLPPLSTPSLPPVCPFHTLPHFLTFPLFGPFRSLPFPFPLFFTFPPFHRSSIPSCYTRGICSVAPLTPRLLLSPGLSPRGREGEWRRGR
ncbi:unnamed protein product [Closterium sp. Naga37s-1]|nr:unnamed protein product [Closterium sp. Naga37s-1]